MIIVQSYGAERTVFRATATEAFKAVRALRRAGSKAIIRAFANWESNKALAFCNAGYDEAVNTSDITEEIIEEKQKAIIKKEASVNQEEIQSVFDTL